MWKFGLICVLGLGCAVDSGIPADELEFYSPSEQEDLQAALDAEAESAKTGVRSVALPRGQRLHCAGAAGTLDMQNTYATQPYADRATYSGSLACIGDERVAMRGGLRTRVSTLSNGTRYAGFNSAVQSGAPGDFAWIRILPVAATGGLRASIELGHCDRAQALDCTLQAE